jgi:hypothetical protein
MSEEPTTLKKVTLDYLRFTHFSVTQTLKEKLPQFAIGEQEKLAFIQSTVIYCARQARHPAMYVNIGAKTFHARTKDYRRYINMLVELGELDVNEAYSQGSFTKSYRIPEAALASGLTTFSAKKQRIRKLNDKTVATTKSIAHQQKCFQQLRVRDEFISTGDEAKDAIAKRALANVYFGCANIRKGKKVQREFNTILEIPSEARRNIVHKDGLQLAEFDFKSCHPFLIIDWASGVEKECYAALITDPNCDIYSYIASEMRVPGSHRSLNVGCEPDRKAIKLDVIKFLNGGGNTVSEKFFQKSFPELHATIVAGGKANAAKLQNLEAAIMEDLGNWCADNGVFYQQQHDGWLGRVDQSAAVSEKLKELVTAKIGVTPTIIIKDLQHTVTTTTPTKTPPSYLSYVVHKENNGSKRTLEPWLIQKIGAERAHKYQRMTHLVRDEQSEGEFTL